MTTTTTANQLYHNSFTLVPISNSTTIASQWSLLVIATPMASAMVPLSNRNTDGYGNNDDDGNDNGNVDDYGYVDGYGYGNTNSKTNSNDSTNANTNGSLLN
ncbi:hypothetical protein PoB_000004500 [Plakobranchus ocellatus]|uniref:Uncharacterized protein n=1 Tax=Plakobranchus ocellatus TaxID=259542 RepID=A0AAV3XSC2_9GAST|nr:hypothetical protein PoB_000004500 [Plakobranchus ocellatus]